MKFFKELDPMECLAGDNIPTFRVRVTGSELAGLSLRLLVIPVANPDKVKLSKTGTAAEDGFTVRLDSTDTSRLDGAYYLDFVVDGGGSRYKKLRGVLTVRRSGRGT